MTLEQLDRFERIVRGNPINERVLTGLRTLALPNAYLAAGCLFQTVWNAMSGNAPTFGIRDYDVMYHDARDLSWAAEDAVITRCAEAFADVDATIEVRNQARVHLWYEEKFGVTCPAYHSTEAAIDSFPSASCCVAARLDQAGRFIVYAPHGLDDLFDLIVRPNPRIAPRRVYEEKTSRWRERWPELRVIAWPN